MLVGRWLQQRRSEMLPGGWIWAQDKGPEVRMALWSESRRCTLKGDWDFITEGRDKASPSQLQEPGGCYKAQAMFREQQHLV